MLPFVVKLRIAFFKQFFTLQNFWKNSKFYLIKKIKLLLLPAVFNRCDGELAKANSE